MIISRKELEARGEEALLSGCEAKLSKPKDMLCPSATDFGIGAPKPALIGAGPLAIPAELPGNKPPEPNFAGEALCPNIDPIAGWEL